MNFSKNSILVKNHRLFFEHAPENSCEIGLSVLFSVIALIVFATSFFVQVSILTTGIDGLRSTISNWNMVIKVWVAVIFAIHYLAILVLTGILLIKGILLLDRKFELGAKVEKVSKKLDPVWLKLAQISSLISKKLCVKINVTD